MTAHELDYDQEAVDWARAKVVKVRDKYRAWEMKAKDEGNKERMMKWRTIANVLEMELIGGRGCVITPLDERLPEMMRLLDDGA